MNRERLSTGNTFEEGTPLRRERFSIGTAAHLSHQRSLLIGGPLSLAFPLFGCSLWLDVPSIWVFPRVQRQQGRGILETREVALLLSVVYAVGDEGQTRTFDCNDDDNDEDDEDDERDENRQRPIHFAAARDDEEMIVVLVSARADLNPADDRGNTPLLAAITTGHLELAQVLIDAGADISAANKQGKTPLLAARAGGHLELAKMLVAASANVKTTRADGAGLLALAIVSQKEELVNFAFEHLALAIVSQKEELVNFALVLVSKAWPHFVAHNTF